MFNENYLLEKINNMDEISDDDLWEFIKQDNKISDEIYRALSSRKKFKTLRTLYRMRFNWVERINSAALDSMYHDDIEFLKYLISKKHIFTVEDYKYALEQNKEVFADLIIEEVKKQMKIKRMFDQVADKEE